MELWDGAADPAFGRAAGSPLAGVFGFWLRREPGFPAARAAVSSRPGSQPRAPGAMRRRRARPSPESLDPGAPLPAPPAPYSARIPSSSRRRPLPSLPRRPGRRWPRRRPGRAAGERAPGGGGGRGRGAARGGRTGAQALGSRSVRRRDRRPPGGDPPGCGRRRSGRWDCPARSALARSAGAAARGAESAPFFLAEGKVCVCARRGGVGWGLRLRGD